MRDKESVTQFFILYGYEKAPDAYSSRGFLFCPQASNVLPGGTIENQGLVGPNSLISWIIPEILHFFVAVIRF